MARLLRILTLTLISMTAFVPIPAQALDLTLVPSATDVMVGDTVDVAFNVSGLPAGSAPSIASYILSVNFDGSILDTSTVVFGDPVLGNQLEVSGTPFLDQDVFPGMNSITALEDGLIFGGTQAQLDANQAGAFTLFTVPFLAVGAGTVEVSATVSGIRDGSDMLLTVDNNTPTTINVTPEPGAALLVGLGLAALALRRRAA